MILIHLECSLLGSLEASPNVGGVAVNAELSFNFKMASNQTCFVLAAAYLFWFSVHLNSTLTKGDTAPLFLNSWGFWENSEPSGLESSQWLLLDWILIEWRSLHHVWSSDLILGGSLKNKLQITNHKFHFPLVGLESQITNSQMCEGV